MKFRHECKHEMGVADMLALRQRLSTVATADCHSENGNMPAVSSDIDFSGGGAAQNSGNVILLAVSAVVLIGGIIFAALYKR